MFSTFTSHLTIFKVFGLKKRSYILRIFGGVKETNSLPSYTKRLVLQLFLMQVSKDQITVSVKFTFPVGGDTTVDFK